MTAAGSGRRWPTSSPDYDPRGSSPRTCPVCVGVDLTLFSETFTDSTTRLASGRSPLAQWEPHTHVTACSSWPTPLAKDGSRGGSPIRRWNAVHTDQRTKRANSHLCGRDHGTATAQPRQETTRS
jgi:hypothetical protein